jgi:hypothetical protein
VIGLLRFVGVANAAVWFGASIFFTFSIGPAFFSTEMIDMIRRLGGIDAEAAKAYAGFVAEIVIKRYFVLHLICGIIALAHLVAEWLYMGKPLQRLTLWLLLGICAFGLMGGVIIQPKLQGFHRTLYSAGATPPQREQAHHSFRLWHAASQALNLVLITGVAVYLWRVSTPGSGYRYRA